MYFQTRTLLFEQLAEKNFARRRNKKICALTAEKRVEKCAIQNQISERIYQHIQEQLQTERHNLSMKVKQSNQDEDLLRKKLVL